jgi:hypothetical protein
LGQSLIGAYLATASFVTPPSPQISHPGAGYGVLANGQDRPKFEGGKGEIVAQVPSTILQSFWLSNRCCPADRVVRDRIPATCYSSEIGPAMERSVSS